MVPYNEDSQLVIKGMEVLTPFFILGMEVLVPCKYGKCLWRDNDQLFSIGYLLQNLFVELLTGLLKKLL